MLTDVLKKLNDKSQILSLLGKIDCGEDCSVFGCSLGDKTWILNSADRQIMYVTESYDLANKIKQQFESMNKSVRMITESDFDLKINIFKNDGTKPDILSSLYNLCKEKADILIVSPQILMMRLPGKNLFEKNILKFEKGRTYDFKTVTRKLSELNYKRVDMVEHGGEFSVRGDIIDVFNIVEDLPYRLEFFGDELEAVSTFNLTTYSQVKSRTRVEICPNTTCFIDDVSKVIDEIGRSVKQKEKSADVNSFLRIKNIYNDIIFRLENGNLDGLSNWLVPFLNYTDNISSYLSKNALVVFDDVKQIVDSVSAKYEEFSESFKLLESANEVLPLHENFLLNKGDVFKMDFTKLSFQSIMTSNRIFLPKAVFSFKQSSVTNYYGKYELLKDELLYYAEHSNTVAIFTKDGNIAVYLQKFLQTNGVDADIVLNIDDIKLKRVNLIPKEVFHGAVFVEDRLVIIGSHELLGKQESRLKTKVKKDVFVLPKIGQYVVHEVYGIGLCIGIERRYFAGFEKDYVVIEYAKGDRLFLPTEQVGLISSYISSSPNQKLNRLGTQEFIRTKERVKKSIKEMAFSLLKLYAEREHAKGFKFNRDDELMREFENTFPFSETPDQMDAITDVKKDMESEKVMDRLICGDVGYGKTEVALRAIFKAVESGKQVAFLAPTTILSEQHFNTCKSRMDGFMVNVNVLNRFKPAREQKRILQDLRGGKIDVLCGTHRLLSADVQFKNLGLLILDEEQRFGVQDKEKIKRLKASIDVLTLSATPIPRTLHMSLSGMRDISLITTAPEGRLPVQTVVTEYSDILVKEAILKEINRGGQVIVVYNSIEHIYAFAQKIRTLIGGEIAIRVVHGQMDERELENSIFDLYNGKIQVLVSTTLIENGIDLPNANTLIIKNADRLGLSQLYQLRGRVGRSVKLGYAYFTYERDKVLTEEAYKRLNALMEFTELGSGFKIAMRDLEIRGCGNVMGKEQHGHMEKVGYDMYCKLLNETVAELKGQKQKEAKEVKIDVAVNCFIPNNYIVESDGRFRVYNRLISIKSEEDRQEALAEIKDIYGKDLPKELVNLSYIVLLRFLCQQSDIKKVSISNSKCQLEFYEKQSLINENITGCLSKSGLEYVLNFKESPIINFEMSSFANERKLMLILDFLTGCVIKA